MAKHNAKIKGEVESLVCNLHAKGLSPTEIRKELASREVKISLPALWNWLRHPIHTEKLQKAIDRYRSDPLAVAIAHKRVRLEDLNKERVDLIATLQRYKDTKGLVYPKQFYRYLNGLKRLIEMEREAREEIERRPDMVAYFQRIGPYADVSNEELRKLDKEITEQIVIVGRQASPAQRVGVSQADAEGTDKR